MIVCIGWGSLIWDRQNLDVDGQCRADGPMLPVEFARQSSKGRITLVLGRGFTSVPTLWSVFDTRDLAEARESLRVREDIPRFRAAESIAQWRRPIPLLPPVITAIFPSSLAIEFPPHRGIPSGVEDDHRADLRSASQLASVITETKPISKYA